MDYYSKLGVKKTSSLDEIKKAYRRLAMAHHPDRGGDETLFKEITEAYEVLSDPVKKQMFDSGRNPNQQNFRQGPFEFHFDSSNMHDIFSQFGFRGQQHQRNKSINVSVEITLDEVLTGKDINAEIGMPGGKNRIVNISIPPGIQHRQQIRYQGMGDEQHAGMPPGDLLVNVFVRAHPQFQRHNNNLLCEHTISVWDAIIGTTVSLKTLDNKTIDVKIPPGTQPETVLSCRGEGLPDMRTKQRGNLLIKVNVKIPKLLSEEHVKLVKQLQQEALTG